MHTTARLLLDSRMPMRYEIRTPLDSFVRSIELIAPDPMAPAQDTRILAMQMSAKALLQVVNDIMGLFENRRGRNALYR
jgi:two-component system capsular synthesis sensor histidine kinase RcsC